VSSITASVALPARNHLAVDGLRAYFAAHAQRTIQTVLGLVWLLDGALQFQSFMYGPGLIKSLTAMAPGEPHWLASPLLWGASAMQQHQALCNTLCALVQIAIGLGILYQRTVKQALLVSFVWALLVWWFGEAFGALLVNTANPLTGAPGAVLLYAFIGAIVWPNDRRGGLLGVTGMQVLWAGLWLVMGGLWLLPANSGSDATFRMIKAAPAGMGWLAGLQSDLADASKGHGLIIAGVLAAVSIVVGLTVALNYRPRAFLGIAIVLNLAYWLVGQGFGGVFAGGATDPNAGPLFVLLSVALYVLIPNETLGPRLIRDRRGRDERGARLAALHVGLQARPLLERSACVGAAKDAGADHVGDCEALSEQPVAAVERRLERSGGLREPLASRGRRRRVLGDLAEPAVQWHLEFGHPKQNPLVDERPLGRAERRDHTGIRMQVCQL
jgi:hypothetical protein